MNKRRMKREAARAAAEEFFRRAHTPPTHYQPLKPEDTSTSAKSATPKATTQLSEGATTVITDWQEGKALLKQLLAEGKIR